MRIAGTVYIATRPRRPRKPTEQRAAERRAARTTLRLYCVMCGRSETLQRVPARPGRCSSCDGTLLTEFDSG